MSYRLTPIKTKIVIKFIEIHGWKYDRTKGGHVSYVKIGGNRPIVIPVKDKEICPRILRQIMEHLKLSKKEFLIKIRKI